MLPAAAAGGGGGGGGAGAWRPGMGVRAVARAHLVLGLSAAALALYAVTIDAADFHPQDAGKKCAATAAEAVGLRFTGLLLLLTGAAQAVAAAATDLAAAGSPGGGLGRLVAFVPQALGVLNAYYLYYVVRGLAAVAVGRCLPYYLRVTLVLCYVLLVVLVCLLLVVGLLATLFA